MIGLFAKAAKANIRTAVFALLVVLRHYFLLSSPKIMTNLETLSRLRKKLMGSAAICSIVKDENKYLEEWLLYHLALGFERIYLYDNSDNSSAKIWLREYHETNTFQEVHVHDYPTNKKRRQVEAYKSCIETYGVNHTWVALFDPDEFLVLKTYDHVSDFLSYHCQNGSVSINWLTFGTGNNTRYVDAPVTQRFQYHSGVEEGTVKTIVRVSDYVGQSSPHWVYLKNESTRHDTHGEWIRGYNAHKNGQVDIAALHHYKYKSLEEFIIKGCIRGDVWIYATCINHTLADLPSGYIWDDSAWQVLQNLVPQYRNSS